MPLTTHVLDTVRGAGAAGMKVALRIAGETIATIVLDEGGRGVLLRDLQEGAYQLLFHAGAYQGAAFYDVIPVHFTITDPAQNYHIPLSSPPTAIPPIVAADFYPRDLIGYAGAPPHAAWPGGARIAVNFVLNYEEGAENSILHGDAASESFLSEMVGAQPVEGMRHISMESLYDYGARAGFWRIHGIFKQRGLPLTVFAVAMAMQRNPAAVQAMLNAGWDIASHGYRWINYQHVDEATEREHMARAIAIHTELTGARPLGWYTGRASPNTARLVADDGGFIYDADSYADDLPYYDSASGRRQLIVPYTLDTNDMRFASPQGFNSGEQFFTYIRDAFDTLYAEGETAPKMLSIGLHCRIIGRPARAAALIRLLDYIAAHRQVWVATRLDIARHWLAVNPP